MGLKAIFLFGIPKKKNLVGSQAYDPDGIVQRAVAAVKAKIKGVVVMTDVCLCEYMSHGHCGIVKGTVPERGLPPKVPAGGRSASGGENGKWKVDKTKSLIKIDNTASLLLLAQTALSHARAGSDMAAPSSMMKRQV